MTRKAGILAALFLSAEVLIIVTHWQQAKSVYISVYTKLWELAPRLDDLDAFRQGRSR